MRRLALAALVLLAATAAFAADPPAPAPRSPEQIRKEMTAVRRGTNWDDAAAANQANERISQLAAELLQVTLRRRPEEQASAAAAAASNTEDPTAGGIDRAKLAHQLTTQMAEAVAGGRESDVLLAKKVRAQIVEEYKADLDPTIKNPDVLAEQTLLVIDFSSPAAPAVVGQMENFRGITTLILTGGRNGAPVDLPAVLTKARGYPLRELYIVSFKGHVSDLPPETAVFADLQTLAVFDNAIAALPAAIGGLQNLETLFADANPLPTVLPVVRSLPKLTKLGVGKTGVTPAELDEIQRLLPDCKILTQ